MTGEKIKSITERLGVPKSTVQDWIKSGRTHPKKRPGRPKAITPRERRHLKRFIKTNHQTRRMSAHAIIEQLKLDVSEATLIKTLAELNIFHRVARRRPFLRKLDRQRRLEYARKYKNWTVEDWKRVIWTDETSFQIGMRRGSVDWIWRSPDEEFHADCIDYTKRPKIGVMFWGSFRWNKMGLIQRMAGI